jgi:MoaA/NifB/PqqE/SkfB family radical SAM enzyme
MLLRVLRGFLRSYLGAPTPVVLCHQLTLRCNLRCPFCPFWRRQSGEELSTREVEQLIEQASQLGCAVYTAWGGEPLLRQDLEQCLRHARRCGMRTYLITNGVLWKRVARVARYLDYLTVSIDGTSRVYRTLRGVEVEHALRSLQEARRRGVKVAINCVVCEANLGELGKLVELAERHGAWISFEPVHRFEEVPGDEWEWLEIRSRERYAHAIEELIRMKKEGRRVLNSLTYLRMMKRLEPRFRCAVHALMLHVDAEGNVETCFGRVGSFREQSLAELWRSRAARHARQQMRRCRGCLFSGYAETSLVYALKPEAVLNTLRILRG